MLMFFRTVCSDFLAGYCPLEDKCTLKHVRVCDYTAARCPLGDSCRLRHRAPKTKRAKTESTADATANAEGSGVVSAARSALVGDDAAMPGGDESDSDGESDSSSDDDDDDVADVLDVDEAEGSGEQNDSRASAESAADHDDGKQ